MSDSVLENIASDEFAESLGTHSTAASLRRSLLRSRQVRELRESLVRGSIAEEEIRRFVAQLLKSFKPGEAFAHELSLAAIAVAIESRNSKFSEDYLIDLARTKVVELATCRRVAALCAQVWAKLPRFEKINAGPYNRFSRPQRPAIPAQFRTIQGNAQSTTGRGNGTFRTA